MQIDDLDSIKASLGKYALPDCFTLPPVLSNSPAYDFELNFEAT